MPSVPECLHIFASGEPRLAVFFTVRPPCFCELPMPGSTDSAMERGSTRATASTLIETFGRSLRRCVCGGSELSADVTGTVHATISGRHQHSPRRYQWLRQLGAEGEWG